MPFETYQGWKRAYDDDPWGEERADDRSAANTLLTLWMRTGADASDAPNLHHPYWQQEQITEDRVARIEAAKKRVLDGKQLNRKTRNPPNDGHVGDDARV